MQATAQTGAFETSANALYYSIDTGTVASKVNAPVVASTNYIVATSFAAGCESHKAFDYSLPLAGNFAGNTWLSGVVKTNQRMHIDLGTTNLFTHVYYENFSSYAGATSRGVSNFTFWGSNTKSAFTNLVYTNDANWVQIPTSITTLEKHVAAEVADPKYFAVTNSTPYRYYAFKFANNWGDFNYMGIRRIAFQKHYETYKRKQVVLTEYDTGLSTNNVPTTSVNGKLVSSSTTSPGNLVGNITLSPPRWQDVIVSGVALRGGGTSPTRELVTPNSGIYGTGFAINEDSDFAGQVQHGVASTNANFPTFYYNPHIHVSVSALTAPNTNATFVLNWQIAPVNSDYLGTSISRTSTVNFVVGLTNFHRLVSFGLITNNVLQGADSLVFRGSIKRISTPAIANDITAKVIVDSLDYHFPFESVGSTAIFGDVP